MVGGHLILKNLSRRRRQQLAAFMTRANGVGVGTKARSRRQLWKDNGLWGFGGWIWWLGTVADRQSAGTAGVALTLALLHGFKHK